MDYHSFLNRPSYDVAPDLIGSLLERTIEGQTVQVRIVETEAYHHLDPASHSFHGRTQRTNVMFGPAGFLYVYFTYGMHYCCNIVTDEEGIGSAVLIRAVEPITNEDVLQHYRPVHGLGLTNGPAKLCQALAIDKSLNGHDLEQPPLRLLLQPPLSKNKIGVSPRIGITKAKETAWRFYDKKSPYVSRYVASKIT